jgi:predicted extracellular nuclease
MGSSMRTVRLVAAAVGLLVWLAAVPVAAGSQSMVVNEIHDIQGAAHLSPFSGQDVSGLEGVVTFERSSSFWMQDPTPDTDEATSEGILVFGTGVGALVNVGDHVSVSGRVLEFRPGGESTDNLTTTEITTPEHSKQGGWSSTSSSATMPAARPANPPTRWAPPGSATSSSAPSASSP